MNYTWHVYFFWAEAPISSASEFAARAPRRSGNVSKHFGFGWGTTPPPPHRSLRIFHRSTDQKGLATGGLCDVQGRGVFRIVPDVFFFLCVCVCHFVWYTGSVHSTWDSSLTALCIQWLAQAVWPVGELSESPCLPLAAASPPHCGVTSLVCTILTIPSYHISSILIKTIP